MSATTVLDGGGGVDFARLRTERRDRLLAEMERHDLDVLVLGREANARYAAGARRLWTAGTRPFGPGCVVVRATGEVHLLSTWDDGIPPEVGRDRIFGISWDPFRLLESLRRIPGFADAARIGVDDMTPLFAQLLAGPVLVDARPALDAARATKTPEELACLRAAIALAERALVTALDGARPGIRESELRARFAEAITAPGVTTPATAGTFCVTPARAEGARGLPLRRLVTDRAVAPGDLVVLDTGVLYAGYEGDAGGTWLALEPGTAIAPAHRALERRAGTALDALHDACRPGRTAAGLREAYTATGEAAPPVPIAYGVGLGAEVLDPDARLTAGMVLVVQAYVWAEGVGGCFAKETLLVTAGEPETMSHLPRGVLVS